MTVELRQIICHGCLRHRWASAYRMVCDEDGRDIIEHAAEGACPLGRYVPENVPTAAPAAAPDPEAIRKAAARLAAAGRLLWEELHTQRTPTADWWADWLMRVGKLGCSCRREAAEILAALGPPPLDDPVAMFWYGWELHEGVNRKLGKAGLTREAAAAQWWPEIALGRRS